MLVREISQEHFDARMGTGSVNITYYYAVRDTKDNKIIAQFVSVADADFFITMYHRMGCS
jgi:hypothetical protein